MSDGAGANANNAQANLVTRSTRRSYDSRWAHGASWHGARPPFQSPSTILGRCSIPSGRPLQVGPKLLDTAMWFQALKEKGRRNASQKGAFPLLAILVGCVRLFGGRRREGPRGGHHHPPAQDRSRQVELTRRTLWCACGAKSCRRGHEIRILAGHMRPIPGCSGDPHPHNPAARVLVLEPLSETLRLRHCHWRRTRHAWRYRPRYGRKDGNDRQAVGPAQEKAEDDRPPVGGRTRCDTGNRARQRYTVEGEGRGPLSPHHAYADKACAFARPGRRRQRPAKLEIPLRVALRPSRSL